MGTVSKALGILPSVTAFCIALTVLLSSNSSTEKLLFEVKNNINDKYVMYEQNLGGEELEKIIAYPDVISMLMKDIRTDIEINGVLLDAATYNYLQFDFSVIPETEYSEVYERNSAGEVIKIVLTSR